MASNEDTAVKTRKKECTTCIPNDIIEQIFVRLPVSSLLRCVCVCKRWRNIIRDPQFIPTHLQHAPRCTLLFFPRESVLGKLYPSEAVVLDEAWSPSTCVVPVIEPDDFLCASCNGLLCFYTKTSTIKITNPATGDCLHLAKPGNKNLKGDHFSHYSLGFHPVTKEYKVIRFHHFDTGDRSNVIQVYTLGDEKWRDVNAPKWQRGEDLGVVNVNGAMYWIILDRESSWQHSVMSFDLKEESFASINTPPVNLDESDHPLSALGGLRLYWITEIDGKVCVASARIRRHLSGGLIGMLQIWTLESEAEHSWSPKYNILLSSFYIPGPHFIHSDKIVMQGRDKYIYSHELLDKDFEIEWSDMVRLLDFSPRRIDNMQSYVYVKSLVRLDIYKGAGIVREPKRRGGWELKRWEAWENELHKLDELWSRVNRMEHEIAALGEHIGVGINQVLPHALDQPRSLRRLNWVERVRYEKELEARMDRIKDIAKVLSLAAGVNPSTLISHPLDQGTSVSTTGISEP